MAGRTLSAPYKIQAFSLHRQPNQASMEAFFAYFLSRKKVGYLPWKEGFRFSMKAQTPSLKSSEEMHARWVGISPFWRYRS